MITETDEVETKTEESAEPVKRDELFDYNKAKEHADRLIHYWHSAGEDAVFKQVENNRAARAAVADVERMRAAAKLDANHTYVGVRLIDGNIVNQLPSHLMYLKQSRRFGVFVPTDSRLVANMIDEITQLESEFTRVMSYEGWEEPFIKVLDGSSLHGRDWLEVLHDESKPGHCAINHVGVEYLLHDPNVADLESSRMIMRSYSITLVDLQRMSLAYGFDEESVKKLTEKLQTEYARDVRVIPAESRLYIYRVFFKDDTGRVYEAWMCKDGESEWLRKPLPWYNGIQRMSEDLVPSTEAGQMDMTPLVSYEDVHQTQYPFFAKLHRITEDPVILRARGRGFLDFYKQDASSATLTAFVNGCLDASRTQWAPTQGGTEGSEPKQLTNVARDGAVWDQPMEAFHSPYPDAALLQAVDKIGILNQAETAQVNWAVNNRQDSRKTATEVQTSVKQQTALSGVEVLMFSLTLSRVQNYAWPIVRTAAQKGVIKFMPDATGKNNLRALAVEYLIKPAGDIDWIERQENVSKMQEDWPVVQSTPMRDMFLEDYVRMRYPQNAEKYIATLRQGALAPQLAQALQRTMAVAQAALIDPATQQLKPDYAEQAPQLMQLAQQNMQLIQQAQAAQGTQPTQNQTRQQLP